jgi:hypothetical protein|tara:strand:- start:624 stop:947 length:324 start_codon:yes stop_codon:yes gene_type:complete
MIALAYKYFEAWNSNNIENLRPLFSEDIILTDWDINASGIEDVLIANKNIFDSVVGIKAQVIDIAASSTDKVFAKLIIEISPELSLTVIDVLTIEHNKIKRIDAYKQ